MGRARREHQGRHVTYPDAASNEAFELVLPALVSHFLQRGVQQLAVKLVQRILLYVRDLLHHSPYFQVPGALQSVDIENHAMAMAGPWHLSHPPPSPGAGPASWQLPAFMTAEPPGSRP